MLAESVVGYKIPTLGVSEGFKYAPPRIAGVLIVLFSIEHMLALSGAQALKSSHAPGTARERGYICTDILCVSFTLLLLLGVPVAFSIGLSSLATILYEGLPLAVGFQQMISGMNPFSFLAIPFFVFAGEIMLYGGIADRIVAFAKSPGRPRARRPGHDQRAGLHAVRRRRRARRWPTCRRWARC